METETYSEYIAYEIHAYYDISPYGPDRCPMCAGDLTRSEIEPSRAMYDKLWDPTRERYRLYVCYRTSSLYTCSECHWWCIRDACDFLDDPERPYVFYFDYLIFAIAEKSGPEIFKDIPESTQPWLKALDDPDVYDKDVVRDLPKELAALMYKRSDATESISIRPRVIRDLSKYDPFIDKTKDLITKKREGKLHKTDAMQLHPGDKVRVIKQTFGHYRGNTNEIVIAKWNIGTVVPYDDFRKSRGVDCLDEKGQIDAGLYYPIRLETDILPSVDECAFLETLHERQYIHGIDYKGGEIWLIDVDCLEKIT
jgi:hypothetical protein